MKFVIKNPVKPKYINRFVLVVDYMHGDADAYTTGEYPFDSTGFDTSALQEEIVLLERAKTLFPHGMRGCDTYAEEAKRLGIDLPASFTDEIPYNQFCEDGNAHLEGYKVVWYDHNGIKHDVEVQL